MPGQKSLIQTLKTSVSFQISKTVNHGVRLEIICLIAFRLYNKFLECVNCSACDVGVVSLAALGREVGDSSDVYAAISAVSPAAVCVDNGHFRVEKGSVCCAPVE